MIYGYARVSSGDQCVDRQLHALKAAGVEKENIFIDHRTGANFLRPSYQRMLTVLKPGDQLIFLSIDRLGRNYREILREWRRLREELGAELTILDMPVLNTKQENDLIGNLISDIVLQLLSYVAQTEREFILQRQREGIAAARQRGVRFGRPPIERPERFDELRKLWLVKGISARAAAETLGVSHTTFLRWVEQF